MAQVRVQQRRLRVPWPRAQGGVVSLLGRGCGLLLGLESACQSSITRLLLGHALTLQALRGGGGFAGLLIGQAPSDLVTLERGGGAIVVALGGW